jgi:hypothetical protein
MRTALAIAFISIWVQTATAQCYPVHPAAGVQDGLNLFWGTNIPVCRLPPGTNNAYADQMHWVVWADQDWLDMMAAQLGSGAPTGILAHEWGHMIQGKVHGTAAELQADCLAGVYLRGMRFPWQTVEQFALSNFFAGEDHWSPYGHGTRTQRVNAARRGYYGFRGQGGLALLALCPLSAF